MKNMGAWGTGLYQDDTTCDIKEDYITYLKVGTTNEEETRIIEENEQKIRKGKSRKSS